MDDAVSLPGDNYYAALREKYRAERDRRIHPKGEQQYIEAVGDFATFAEQDPYAPEPSVRAPLHDDVEIVIVGGGWAGQFAAARLSEAGVTEFRIIDDGADFGGTWYWNRYPGAQCDIESYCYLPLLEETGYMPKEKYSFAPEIFEHAQRIGKFYGLYDKAVFQTRVTEMRWDEDIKRWRIKTNRDDEMKARFVVLASGLMSRPKLPGVPGFDEFQGHTFHTCRWDYDYTGGDHGGRLHKLRDKTVAIIGTGATAIQCVPHVGGWAKHLYVFQRTPSSVDLRGNKPTDPAWASSLTPGWQEERRRNFNDVVTGKPFDVDLVADGWTDIFRRLASDVFAIGQVGDGGQVDPKAKALRAEIADFNKMDEIRARCDREVSDPKTAEALKPYYRQFCKRPTFNDDYLPTFDRPNVTLVDTSASHGVERLTRNGVVANGVEYEVDCIILATGFERSTTYRRRLGVEVYGKGGKSLYDHWDRGMRTLHGHSAHGFPNWFFVSLSQVGLSFNYASIVDEMASHVAYIIAETRRRGATTVEATAAGEQFWVDEIHANAGDTSFLESCTPGYYNNEGQLKEVASSYQGDFYTPGSNVFNAILADWRKAGDLKDMTVE